MNKLLKYCCLFILLSTFNYSNAQFLCDYEIRMMNKQKRKVRKSCSKISKEWVKKHTDSLNIPNKIKLSKFKFEPKKDEYEKGEYFPFSQWESTDSLLCVNDRKNNVDKAINNLEKLNLTIYQITTTFTPTNADNPEISSSLFFQYGIKGKLIRVILRKKEMSRTSEIFFH